MKKIVSGLKKHKKIVSIVAFVLVVALIFGVVNSRAIIGVSATERNLPVYCVKRDDKCVSLTFDAAWGNEDTEQLIEILQKYNVTATFFLVGAWVDKYPSRCSSSPTPAWRS